MRITTKLLALAVLACGGPQEPTDTTIQVKGTVAAASDGSPIVGAEITVHKLDHAWYEVRLLRRTLTDSLGHYSVEFVWPPPCDEYFKIEATASGFLSTFYTRLRYNLGRAPTYIRCTEETQTIDFQLWQAS